MPENDRERIMKGKVGEVELDSDGYVRWVRIDKGKHHFVIYPTYNPNDESSRLTVSQIS